MNTLDHKLTVLARTAHALNGAGVRWAMASSVVLYFNGVAGEFRDLDIMVEEADFDAAAAALTALGTCHQPVLLPDKYATKRFLVFEVEGVEIDLMGGFAIVKGGAVYHFPYDPATVDRTVQVQGEIVPLQGVELWRRCYELMGRAARVEAIDRWLAARRSGADQDMMARLAAEAIAGEDLWPEELPGGCGESGPANGYTKCNFAPKVYFKAVHPAAKAPVYATPGAAAADLCAVLEEPLTLAPGGRAMVPTGLAIQLPGPEWVALLCARSGLAVKHGLTLANGVGVIDSDYRGEVKAGLVNLGTEPYTLQPGERVAQLMILPVAQAAFVPADVLEESQRGEGGFGSTGR